MEAACTGQLNGAPTGPITDEVEEAHKVLCALEEKMSVLARRLEPVSVGPVNANAGDEPVDEASPLRDRVRTLRQRLHFGCQCVDEMLARLEI